MLAVLIFIMVILLKFRLGKKKKKCAQLSCLYPLNPWYNEQSSR